VEGIAAAIEEEKDFYYKLPIEKNRIFVCLSICIIGVIYCTGSGFHFLVLVD
jgi:hypothetical protein